MGIAEVQRQIIEDAEKQAKETLQAAQAEAQKVQADTEKEVLKYEAELRVTRDKMLSAAEKKELAAAEFDGKRLMLDKKKELIQKAVNEARAQLQGLSGDARRQLIERLLAEAKREIDVKVIYANQQDKPLLDKLLLKEKGIAVKEKNVSGGIIAETADGKISVDLSFDMLLQETKERYIQQISEVLFSG